MGTNVGIEGLQRVTLCKTTFQVLDVDVMAPFILSFVICPEYVWLGHRCY